MSRWSAIRREDIEATAKRIKETGTWIQFNNGAALGRPKEVLQGVTLNGGLVAKMTGPNNPYPKGNIGVIEEGAYADILLVNGNPLEDPLLLMDAQKICRLSWKTG